MISLANLMFFSAAFTLVYLSFRWISLGSAPHRTNRIILLGIPVVALGMSQVSGRETALIQMDIPAVELNGTISETHVPEAFPWLMMLYLAGVILMVSFRLVYTVIKYNELKKDPFHAFTLLGKIHIGNGFTQAEAEMVHTHESNHLSLGHGFDLIFMEGIKIALWWLPTVYFWANDLKLIHEFEADQGLVHHGKAYKKLLVERALGTRLPLAHSFSIQTKVKARLAQFNLNQNYMKRKMLWWIPAILLITAGFNQIQAQSKKEVYNYSSVDQVAEYPGGMEGLATDMQKNFKYPKSAEEAKIEGKVFVQFVIDEKGAVTDAKVIRGVDPALDEKALEMVNALQDWEPAMNDGKPVKVAFTIPVKFELGD